MSFSFRPRLLETLKAYGVRDFLGDLFAGMSVGLVALPLAMAFAIASGLAPQAGLYTAITAGFLISALGGSRVQIGGPAGAYIVIVYGIVSHYGVHGLIISTIMAGIILFIMGLFRWGAMIKFVPVAIVTGFTNGIAVLIALSQVKDILGLRMDKLPSEFIPKVEMVWTHLSTMSMPTAVLSALCVGGLFGWSFLQKRLAVGLIQYIPASVVVLVSSAFCVFQMDLPVATLGTQFGGIASSLPSLTIPSVDVETLSRLLRPAMTIALLGAIESLLCARVADDLIGDRHDPNQELMAQGIANVVAPLFGGYCATGTIARTVTSVKMGAKTPIAGMVHAITLLLIILVAAPLAIHVPMAALGAILLFVAYGMGEWKAFVTLWRFSNNYRLIYFATFLLTVMVDLTVALEVSLGLSFLFFAMRIKSLSRLERVSHGEKADEIQVYHLYGSLFFGTVNLLEELMEPARVTPKVLIINLSNVLNLDSSGVEALEKLLTHVRSHKGQLVISQANAQIMSLFKRSNFYDKLGPGRFFGDAEEALAYAKNMIF